MDGIGELRVASKLTRAVVARGTKFGEVATVVRFTSLSLTLLLSAGCSVLSGPSNPRTYFTLGAPLCDEAARATASHSEKGKAEQPERDSRGGLLVTSSAPLYLNTPRMIFSRSAGTRGYYQFAFWIDTPATLISEALAEAVRCTGRFSDVSLQTADSRAEAVLEIRLEEFFHDATLSPGLVRVQLITRYVERALKPEAVLRRFSAAVAVESEDAEGAHAGFVKAVEKLTSEILSWISQELSSSAGNGAARGADVEGGGVRVVPETDSRRRVGAKRGQKR